MFARASRAGLTQTAVNDVSWNYWKKTHARSSFGLPVEVFLKLGTESPRALLLSFHERKSSSRAVVRKNDVNSAVQLESESHFFFFPLHSPIEEVNYLRRQS